MDISSIFSAMNTTIVVATVIINCFFKQLLGDKKIKGFELTRLLPFCVLVIAETLCILHGISIGEELSISAANGIICAEIAVLGYDSYKNVFLKENNADK